MSEIQHAAHCNISEKLSDVCSCGADGTPTYDTLYKESYVLRLNAELTALRADIATYVQLSADQQGEIERLMAERDEALRIADKYRLQCQGVEDEFHEADDEITRLRAALTTCADDHRTSAEQFAFYAEQHRAKSPPDETKAATNDAHAMRCAAASLVARDTGKTAMEGK
jgi:chromosome segregation ATPase